MKIGIIHVGLYMDHGEVIHNEAYVTSTWGTPSIFIYVEGKKQKD